jgi:hypothetical protein
MTPRDLMGGEGGVYGWTAGRYWTLNRWVTRCMQYVLPKARKKVTPYGPYGRGGTMDYVWMNDVRYVQCDVRGWQGGSPDVAFVAVLFAFAQLGGEVERRADTCVGDRQGA